MSQSNNSLTKGVTIWFTGLSGAGKSTIATHLIDEMHRRGHTQTELLDGDEVRQHLSKGLGFSKEDRDTNILRIGYVAKLLTRNGAIAITAAISPYSAIRDRVRKEIGNFVEVYVSAPLETLVHRDVKGLYKKALAGEIQNFTGVSDPYESPLTPEVIVETDKESVSTSVQKVVRALELLGYIPDDDTALSEEDEESVIAQLYKIGKPPVARSAVWVGANAVSRERTLGGADNEAGSATITPHGGTLVNRFVHDGSRNQFLEWIDTPHSLVLSKRQWSDIELIANGAYSPLEGFIGEDEYRSIINNGRLPNGLAWTIPILLLVDEERANRFSVGDNILLQNEDGTSVAVLQLNEKFRIDKQELAQKVWRTNDQAHPGVQTLYNEGDVALAGTISVVRLEQDQSFKGVLLSPTETRAYFTERNWKTVVAFQTRNPVHRAHEYIQKVALELLDGLLLHPLVGETKSDDIPASVRLESYKVLLQHYYPHDRVLLSVLPAAMRYAGPKEAIHHAIMRQNYGCTHFIVGRDHAGVGTYYGTYDAQKLFDEYTWNELAITPLKFEHTFFCKRCDGVVSERTCPHNGESRLVLSGTKVRELLERGDALPKEFSRPEVVQVLLQSNKFNRRTDEPLAKSAKLSTE